MTYTFEQLEEAYENLWENTLTKKNEEEWNASLK